IHLLDHAAHEDHDEWREPEEGEQRRPAVDEDPAQGRFPSHRASSTRASFGIARIRTRIAASEPSAIMIASAAPRPKSSILKLSAHVKYVNSVVADPGPPWVSE